MQEDPVNRSETDNSIILSTQPIWKSVRDAIKGTEADYTTINLNKAILLLAIPMILELVMESTFALVDIFFVSKLGASAVATVGLTETYLYLLYSLSAGLSMAVTAIIARRIGEKNREIAGRTAVQAVFIGFLCSIPFAIAGIFFSKELLILMGADQWALENGYRYTQWMLGGNIVVVLLFVINSIYRGAGDAAIAMKMLFISNGINIILDPLLIFGLGPIPAMGIEGAAIATVFSRAIAVFVQFWLLFRGGKHIRILVAQLHTDAKIFAGIIRTSIGGVGQMIVGMASWIFLMRILSDIGSEAVAGSTIALRIMLFTLMPAWGISNAAATLVGQNLGAGFPDRAESAVWKIGLYNMIFLIAVSFVYFFFNRTLMSIFSQDETVITIGATWLRILSYSYFVYGWWMVSVQAFNGAGDTRTPTWINLVFFWLIEIPLCYLLAIALDHGYSGVFWGCFFAETSVGLFTLWLFSRGKWKTFKV
jgi:putative MATE family efflux protein